MRNLLLLLVGILVLLGDVAEAQEIEVPILDGAWIKIADREPDVGEYNNPGKHNVCDFTIWQDAAKVWRMVACVRQVNWPKVGERIFHHWESASLTEPNWKPLGVFSTPSEELKQYASIQAPHSFPFDGKFYMFYNGGTAPGEYVPMDPANPRKARSKGNSAWLKASDDGKTFTDAKNTDGDYAIFSMGRDVMVFHDKDNSRFIAYFQDKNLPSEEQTKNGAMYCRTASRPEGPWSERTNIGNKGNPESPFVIKRGEWYYLWEQMTVFASKDPTVFNEDPIYKMTPGVQHGYFAPEIIEQDGQYYIAGYAQQGIFLAKFKWEKKTADEIKAWRETEWAKIVESKK